MNQLTNKIPIYNYKWVLFNILLLFILKTNSLIGQETPVDTLQVADSTTYADMGFNFVMLDFNYTNNKIKMKGTEPDIAIPAFISDFSFLHKTGLKTGFMLTNYSGADSLSYDFDLQLGFQKYILNGIVDIDINYIYHNYSGVYDFEGIKYKHALNLSTGLTYEMLYLYGDGNFYLDNENYFTDFGLSTLLDFDKLLFKDDYLFIQPTTSFTFGTDYYLYDIYKPYIDNYLLPLLKFRGYPVEQYTSEDIIERYLQNNGLSSSTYSYQGLDFLVPVTYGINSISVSFSWMYYIPSDKLKAFGMKDQSGYIISLSFIF